MSHWILRLLLSLYPAELRRAHGPEMLAVAEGRWEREQSRDGIRGRLRFWSYFLKDLVRALPRAWMSRRGTSSRPPEPARARNSARPTDPARAAKPARPPDPGRPPQPGASAAADHQRRDSRPARRSPGEVLVSILRDVRLALRNARRQPGFTLTVVAVLALGIGANTAVFSAVDAALLRQPPWPEPDRLVIAHLDFVDPDSGTVDETNVWSFPKFRVLRDHAGGLDPVAGYTRFPMTLTGSGLPARVDVEIVSPAYFGLLGVRPARGGLLPDDDSDAPLSVVLSHGLWQTRFGGEPGVIGQTLTLEGQPLQIAGVMPGGFRGLTGAAELWIGTRSLPTIQSPRRLEMRFAHWLRVVGRLAPGVSLGQAQAGMSVVDGELDEGYRWEGQTHDQRVRLEPLVEARANPTAATSLNVLMGAVGLVLLITCANVAGLLGARNRTRHREMAVRAALGAGRGRLLRQQLTESLVLAGLGGLAGLAVATMGIRWLSTTWPGTLARAGSDLQLFDPGSLGLDPAVLGFAAAATLLTGVLFGILPALRGSRVDLSQPLKEGSGAVSGRHGRAGRSLLAGGQVALATMLLVVAGLLLGSLRQLQSVDLGFRPESLLTFHYRLTGGSTAGESPAGFHAELLEELRALPGVEAAANGCLPMDGCDIVAVTRVVGEPPPGPDDVQATRAHPVSAGYFETLRIRRVAGRLLDEGDREGSQLVAVVNEAFAREFFPGDDPLGREFRPGVGAIPEDANVRIVGVVEDVLHGDPGDDPFPTVYLPARQAPDPRGAVAVRAAGDPLALVGTVREVVARLDSDLPVFDVATMQSRVDADLADTRMIFRLLALFAGIALALASLGVYGVIAWSVSRRTRELGLRKALGAGNGELLRLVVRQGLGLTAAGLMAGCVGALAATRFVESLLYRVEPSDPFTFLGVAAILTIVALVAAWVPARRATRVDPMEALRIE